MSVPVIARIHYYSPDSKRRDFYSSSLNNDYIAYIDKGIDAGKGADKDYMSYMGNPDKSTGVFSSNGILNPQERKKLREELRKAKGNIWDLVISTDEDLGKEKLANFEQAYSLLKDVLPKFFTRLGLSKENVIWYAGLHTSTDNRHCHISFFEKEPSFYNIHQGKYCYRRGRVQGETLRLLKSDIETHLLKEKGEAKEIRDTLLKEIKQGKIETVLSSSDPILKAELREVLERIPYKGRKSYASLNKETRRHLDNLSSIILSSSSEGREMLSSLARLRKKEEKTRGRYHSSKKGLQTDLLERDLYRRVGNHLIDTLIQKRDEAFKEYDSLVRPDIQRRRQLNAISTMLNHMIQDMKERQYYEDLWWKELLKRVKKEMEQEKGETEKE